MSEIKKALNTLEIEDFDAIEMVDVDA
ncbi:lantibiotic precursor peptide, partial [Bacillus cereus]